MSNGHPKRTFAPPQGEKARQEVKVPDISTDGEFFAIPQRRPVYGAATRRTSRPHLFGELLRVVALIGFRGNKVRHTLSLLADRLPLTRRAHRPNIYAAIVEQGSYLVRHHTLRSIAPR